MTRLGALLLAAGGSTRMRRPKLLLQWGDQTVIGASLGALLDAPIEWIGLVTGALGDSISRRARTAYRLWPATGEKPFLRVVHNPAWQEGMGRSLALGLEHVRPHLDGLFIALGDMPAVSTEIYRVLAERFRRHPDQILRPVYQGRPGHPVLFPMALLTGAKPAGDEGLRQVLTAHKERVRMIEVEDAGVVMDLDTPEAYRSALAWRRSQKPPSGLSAAALLEPKEER